MLENELSTLQRAKKCIWWGVTEYIYIDALKDGLMHCNPKKHKQMKTFFMSVI